MKRALFLLAACGQPTPKPVAPPPPAEPPIVVVAPADAARPTQEETLAAIQKAMNDLKVPAQQCWAKVAAERFDVAGDYEALIEIADHAAQVSTVTETTHDAKLIECMHAVLTRYAWAPPLRGQTIRLPFKWRATDGQNVIQRTLVPSATQGKITVGVLLDQRNTGNAAASMLEVGIEAGGTTGRRRAERAELWYFPSWKPDESPELAVTVSGPSLPRQQVVAGDMLFVPAGAVREIAVGDATHPSALRAVLVIVPGGREGIARGGALPTAEATTGTGVPVVVHAADVKQTGLAKIFVDGTKIKQAPLAASLLHFAADANIVEHVHAHETELLYTFSHFGADTVVGTLTVNGVAQEVTDASVIQIPPNTRHSYVGKAEAFALQVYTPAGPEQRFKK